MGQCPGCCALSNEDAEADEFPSYRHGFAPTCRCPHFCPHPQDVHHKKIKIVTEAEKSGKLCCLQSAVAVEDSGKAHHQPGGHRASDKWQESTNPPHSISAAKQLIFAAKYPAVLDRKISEIPWSSTSLCASHMLGPQIAPPDH